MGRLVRVRGAGAVRVARDELLALLAFVVHRVAQRARDRREENNERDAENEDAARKVEALAFGHLREESIAVVFSFVVCLVTFFTSFNAQGSLMMLLVNFRMQFNFQALHCRAHHGRHQSKRLR